MKALPVAVGAWALVALLLVAKLTGALNPPTEPPQFIETGGDSGTMCC